MRAPVLLAYYTLPTLLKNPAPEPAGGQAMTQYTARLTGAVPFNLQETFECGQCFRWLPGDDGSYTGVVGRNGHHPADRRR